MKGLGDTIRLIGENIAYCSLMGKCNYEKEM